MPAVCMSSIECSAKTVVSLVMDLTKLGRSKLTLSRCFLSMLDEYLVSIGFRNVLSL